MNIYIVVRVGIYNHEITGVYSDKELAIDRSIKCFEKEKDKYHDFDVYKFELDNHCEYLDPNTLCGNNNKACHIFSAREFTKTI